MEIFLAVFYFVTLLLGITGGASIVRPEVRETTVKFCIEKPAECKKEFDFYKAREEFNASRENNK